MHIVILRAVTKKLKWNIIGESPLKEIKWCTKKYLINNFFKKVKGKKRGIKK